MTSKDEQGEIIARMNRWAHYRWQPPPSTPSRDARLAGLWDPWRIRLAGATDADWGAVEAVLRSDPGWLGAYNVAVELGRDAGRAPDIRAASEANPWDWRDDHGIQYGRFAAYAVLLVAVLADVLPIDLHDRLVAPWRAAFGPVPATW